MDKKYILVNATSATMGGSLTILNQFISNIDKSDKEKVYYIFVPCNYTEITTSSNVNIIKIDAKSYIKRSIWDLYGIRRWIKKEKIKPSLIISLQNTGVYIRNVNQIVYLHQSIPYVRNISWSFFKKDERKLWFYKYIYRYIVKFSITKKTYIIVQSSWMKDELIREGYKESNIIVSKPTINDIDIKTINPIDKEYKYIFYPASDYKYKNHTIIIEAVKKLVDNSDFKNIKIVFTCNKESYLYKKVISEGLQDYFEFIGNVPYEKVLSLYKGCKAVVFPSYIETYGLPLIEASLFGKKIAVSDCEYSREVLKGYKLAEYVKSDDIKEWGEKIMLILDDYDLSPYKIERSSGWNSVFELINHLLDLQEVKSEEYSIYL